MFWRHTETAAACQVASHLGPLRNCLAVRVPWLWHSKLPGREQPSYGGQPIVQAGLVQFSNGACVELPLGIPKAEAVEDCISGMVREWCRGGFQCALALGRVMSVHQALQHSSLHCIV